MNEAIKTLKQWIDDSDNIVFFGGAGVSTESGIKDFRSVDKEQIAASALDLDVRELFSNSVEKSGKCFFGVLL